VFVHPTRETGGTRANGKVFNSKPPGIEFDFCLFGFEIKAGSLLVFRLSNNSSIGTCLRLNRAATPYVVSVAPSLGLLIPATGYGRYCVLDLPIIVEK
jgi:hypothetical protein